MAKKIQIPAGIEQHINALYNNSSKKREEKEQRESTEETEASEQEQGVEEVPLLEKEKTLIIMTHGFPGHMSSNNDLYGDLEFILAEKGFDTLRFDFRGCGKSDGMTEDFTLERAGEDFKHVLYWAAHEEYKRFIYVGEGFGATLCTMNLTPSLNAAILLWPILDLESYYKQHFANEKLDPLDKVKNYIEKDGQIYGLDFLKELKKTDISDKLIGLTVPALVMHGAQDETVSMEHVDMARDMAGSKRIEITVFQDGEHGLQKLNHRKMMFYHISQFIEKYY